MNDFEPHIHTVDGGAAMSSASYASPASLSPNSVQESALVEGVGIGNAGFDAVAASFAAADTNRDGRLNRAEFQRFYQGGI